MTSHLDCALAPSTWTPETELCSPGVWLGVPELTYHALPYCSSSRLRRAIERSYYAANWERLQKPAEAIPEHQLRLGTAMHVALLEPEFFSQRVQEFADFRAKDRKAAALDLLATGGAPLSHGEYAKASALHRGHGLPKEVSTALGMLDYTELTILREIDGVLVKHRIDGLAERSGFVLDVKTGRVDEGEIAKKLYTLGYDIQAALYLDAVRWWLGDETEESDDYLVVTVTQDCPVEASIYTVAPEAIDIGRRRYRKALRRWAECERTGEWPMRMSEVKELRHPAWAVRAIEEELAS